MIPRPKLSCSYNLSRVCRAKRWHHTLLNEAPRYPDPFGTPTPDLPPRTRFLRRETPYHLAFTEHPQKPKDCDHVSDQEWELRTGRAIYVLQETLPTFFQTGLITCVDTVTGEPQRHSSQHHSSFHIPILDSTAASEFLSSALGGSKTREADEEDIYSPNVRLQYTPPVALPAPLPRVLRLEGHQMYLASASLVRHSMNTLYNDLAVTLTKVSVHTSPPPDSDPGSGSVPMSSGLAKQPRKNREKYLLVRQLVTGVNRVTDKEHEWEIESLYTFSPASGLVLKHTVNSIRPAPHIAVYDLLKGGLGQLLGLGSGGPAVNGSPTHPCVGRSSRK